jgi:hypothetical protein
MGIDDESQDNGIKLKLNNIGIIDFFGVKFASGELGAKMGKFNI